MQKVAGSNPVFRSLFPARPALPARALLFWLFDASPTPVHPLNNDKKDAAPMEGIQEREVSNLTVSIDRSLCIGSGNCVNLAPEVFVIDEENLVTFTDEPEDIDQDRLKEACMICPVDALTATSK